MKLPLSLLISVTIVSLGGTLALAKNAVAPTAAPAKQPEGRKQKQRSKPAARANRSSQSARTSTSSKQTLEHLPTNSSLQTPFALYKSGETSVTFKYPRDWKSQKSDDKNNVVKLVGTTSSGGNGEISLSRFDDASVKAATAKHLVEDLILNKLDNIKKLQEKTVAIGPSKKLPGYLQDVSFNYQGMNASQRWVYFDTPDGTHYFTFTAPVEQFNSLMPIYNEVLLTVQTGSGGSTGTVGSVGSPEISASSGNELSRFASSKLPLSFSYPAGWKVEEEAAGDKAVQIKGENKQGQAAELTIYRGASLEWTSTEQLADAIEKEFYQPQDGFRRVNRQSKEFGNMSKMSGVLQENTFKYKGQPVKQMVAIFEHNDKAYAMSLISPGWKESEMQQLFHRVLASMSVKD